MNHHGCCKETTLGQEEDGGREAAMTQYPTTPPGSKTLVSFSPRAHLVTKPSQQLPGEGKVGRTLCESTDRSHVGKDGHR